MSRKKNKMEYPPLLPAGVHEIAQGDLMDLTCFNEERNDQHDSLIALISFVQRLIERFEIYIDGSFLTEKPYPEDIDCSIFFDPSDINNMLVEDIEELKRLQNKAYIRAQYGIDLYVEPTDSHRKAYWRGMFGYYRDEVTPKGIALVKYEQ